MPTEVVQPEDLTDEHGPIQVGAAELAWSQAWQLPVLLLGLGLLIIGVYFALPRYSETDYPGVLADIEVHLKASELEQAEDKLDALLAELNAVEGADSAVEAHLWQLYGDLRFRQIDKRVWQDILTPVGEENIERVVSNYRKAEQLGRDLPMAAMRRYAEALATRGRDAEALALIDRMPRDMDPARYELVRDLIERRMKSDPDPSSDNLSRLIGRFEKELESEQDKVVKLQQQVWVMGVKAERLLRADDLEGVLALLVDGGLIRLRRDQASDRDLAPLLVRLGEAYLRLGQFDVARLHLSEAQRHLPEGDPMNPRVMVAFGDVTLAESRAGAYEQAYHHYLQAYNTDKMGPSSIDAIIGLGHTEANRDDRFPESLRWFTLAVERMLTEQLPSRDARRKRLVYYLRDLHAEREYERGRYAEALQLLQAYEPLEAPDLGASTLFAFARVYEKLGEQALAQAKALEPGPDTPGADPNLQARRIHNQDAARYFEQAGDYYRQQAGGLTHTTDEHGEALWSSAKSYEQAQRWDLAVEVYTDFLSSSDEADRLEEASFRVAQALLAEGQYEAAVQRLRQIIQDAPSGELAKQSYVPLAQGLGELGRWGEAEKVLRSVIEDHPSIGSDSPYYHDALVALGKLFYTRGADDPVFYARAIEVLGTEGGAVERYQNHAEYQREMPTLRYMLADSLRLSARGLLREAELARTEKERLDKLAERTRRITDAQMYYNQVIYHMKDWHPDSFSQLELQYFRNAYFYQADCAFERADFENAIGLYLNAVRRWQDHPAALVGWVQIMNARAELGQIEEARLAHARAIELFNQMPEGAFERADSLMTRERWDSWLQWMNQLDLFGPVGATAEVPTAD